MTPIKASYRCLAKTAVIFTMAAVIPALDYTSASGILPFNFFVFQISTIVALFLIVQELREDRMPRRIRVGLIDLFLFLSISTCIVGFFLRRNFDSMFVCADMLIMWVFLRVTALPTKILSNSLLIFLVFNVSANIADRLMSGGFKLGLFYNTGLGSNFAGLALPIILIPSGKNIKWPWRMLKGVAIGVVVFYYFTESNSRLFYISALIFLISKFNRAYLLSGGKRLVAIIAGASLFLIVLPVCIWGYKTPSTYGRALIYKISWMAFKGNALTGIGFDQFKAQYNVSQANFVAAQHLNAENTVLLNNTYYLLNDIIQPIIELGFWGLALVLFFFFLIFQSRQNAFIKVGTYTHSFNISIYIFIACCLCSYPLHSFSTNVLMLMIFSIWGKHQPSFKLRILSYESFRKHLLAFALSITLISFIFIFIQAKNYLLWYRTQNATYQNTFDKFMDFDNASNYLQGNAVFLYNYGSDLAMSNRHEESIKVLNNAIKKVSNSNMYIYLGYEYQMLKKYHQAIDCYTIASQMVPHKIYAKYCLMKLYYAKADYSMSKLWAQKVIGHMTKVQSSDDKLMKNDAAEIISLVDKKERTKSSNVDSIRLRKLFR